jgi:hypothetical protein
LTVLPELLAAQTASGVALDVTPALMVPVYTTLIIVVGILIALPIALHKTSSKDRADVIRAVGDLFRFRRGKPTPPPSPSDSRGTPGVRRRGGRRAGRR